MNKDEQYMRRAIDLAKLGAGRVSPNPMVGAVVVHDDKIIGEGWHKAFGGPHAEVHALASVENTELLSDATVYVTLEPCSHVGKTPPCADLLVERNVRRVVIGIGDSNPKVAGRGLRRLESAGIEVSTDVLREECYWLNRPFFIMQQQKRPYIILKWAQTSDGFIARSDYSSKWISKPESRVLVHKWRAEADAILVGRNTALRDDPSLTVRDWTGNDPVRIVIDRNDTLPGSLDVFTTKVPTICYTRHSARDEGSAEWVALGKDMGWMDVFSDMYERGMGIVLVEGGTAVLNALISENLWDEARIFVSEAEFGSGIEAPALSSDTLVNNYNLPDVLSWHVNPNSDG